MLSALLPAPLLALAGVLILGASLVAHFLAFLPLMLLKVLVPIPALRDRITDALIRIAMHWAWSYKRLFPLLYPIRWDVQIDGLLDPRRSYLLVCNHQSWLDIPVLCVVLHGRAPFPRFFVKRELLYVPIIGVACWAMEFPFMKRYSREQLAANPALAREDLATTRRACRRFRKRPATVVNFLEGTRFTEAKRVQRRSPYRHLLRPKAGGIAYALDTMGKQVAGILDVTIAYEPSRHPPILSFLLGGQCRLRVHVDLLPVPEHLKDGDYLDDPEFRRQVQDWVNRLWQRKDARLDRMHEAWASPRPPAERSG